MSRDHEPRAGAAVVCLIAALVSFCAAPPVGAQEGGQAKGSDEEATAPPHSDGDDTDEPDVGEAEAEPDDVELSEEELRLLEQSLEADAAERDDRDEVEAAAEHVSVPFPTAAGPRQTQTRFLDISVILDAAAAYFSGDPLQLGAHDPSATGFNLQQLEMSLGANVDPFFRFDSNIVFAQFGVEVEEAYATTLDLPANLQARAGQFLTRFGRINDTHPHAWSFVDQPMVNGKFFGGEGSRGLGAEVSWLSPLPWYVELVGATTMADGACCARSFYGGDNPGVSTPADLVATMRVEQFFPLSDDWSLMWGTSAQAGPNPTGASNRTEIAGTDLYLRYRPRDSQDRAAVSLSVEAMARRRQVPDDVLADYGGYASLVWEIDQWWEVGGRYEWVSGEEDDYLDPDWTESRRRASAQLTYYPTHFSRLRLQGAWDRPGWRPSPIWAGFLALEVVVGAHGAHGY